MKRKKYLQRTCKYFLKLTFTERLVYDAKTKKYKKKQFDDEDDES